MFPYHYLLVWLLQSTCRSSSLFDATYHLSSVPKNLLFHIQLCDNRSRTRRDLAIPVIVNYSFCKFHFPPHYLSDLAFIVYMSLYKDRSGILSNQSRTMQIQVLGSSLVRWHRESYNKCYGCRKELYRWQYSYANTQFSKLRNL